MPRQTPRRQQRDPRQQEWGAKSNRQYEDIKTSQLDRGASEGRAEEIAARTVNKNRARSGAAKQASATSKHGESPQRRGGHRSGKRLGPSGGPTKEQLYNDAKKRNIKGRSTMTKHQLQQALGR
ncbi:plasmid stabilization protein [Sciscionella marina]|uniref:plasmid stabilization protein n=1 Tax=Sciscionella marina TaxID=508770 RepID=UPI0003A1ABC6|nr:plasmid stabilization protein [Sciscionella marina]